MLKQIAKYWPKNIALKIVSGIGLGVLALILAVYIAAQTPWAKDQAKTALEAALANQSVAKLSLSNLGGVGLAHLSVDQVTLSDEAGTWFQAKDITIRWRPLALLFGKADISEISIAEMTASRRPQPGETAEPSEPSGSRGLPDLPVSITVDRLSIDRLHLQPLSDAPLDDLVATASAKWHSDDIALKLDVHALNTDQYVLLAEISLDPNSYDFSAKINGKEGAGGSLAKRFDLGPNGPLLADIDVTGRIPELIGSIHLSNGAQSLADITFEEAAPENTGARSVKAASRMTGTIAVPDPETRTWHPLDIAATLSLHKDQVIAFSDTTLKDDGFTVTTSGQLDLEAQDVEAAYALSGSAGPIIRAYSGADFASAGGKGTARRSGGDVTVDAALNFSDIKRGTLVADTLDMVAKLTLAEMGTDSQSLAVTADGKLAARPAQNRTMDALFEEPLTFSAAISQKPGTEQIVIEKCDIVHPVVTATVKGTVGSATPTSATDKPLQISANMNVADLNALGELLALPVSGDRLTAKVTVSGNTGDPSAEFTASSGTLIYRGRTFDDLEASGRIIHATTLPDGTFTVTAQTSGQPLTIDATVAPAETGPARFVSDLNLRAPQSTAIGSIALDDGFFPLSADLQADIADLSLWSWVLEQDLAGALQIDAKLTPSGTGPAILKADIKGKNIAYGTTLQADSVILRTSGPMDRTTIDQNLELTAQALRSGNTKLDRLQLTAQGGPNDLTADLVATGRQPRPFDLTAQVTTQVSTAATEPTRTTQIGTLKWSVDDDVWTLTKPATLTTTTDTTVLDALTLKSKKGGALRAELTLAPTARSANVTLDKLPLSLATFANPSLDFVGRVSGKASLNATGDSATAKADLDVNRLATRRMSNARTVDGKLSARLSGNRLTSTLSLDSGPAGTLKATAAIPVTYTAQTGFAAPPTGKLTAAIDGSADLGAIWSLSGVPSQTLVGAVTADVNIGGTVAKPVARGTINIADAEYQHLEYGILLTKMNIDGAINNKRIDLNQFTASDGGAGTIDVNGHVTLDPGAGMPAEFTANIDKAVLVQRADVLARLSGDIVYKSAATKKSVTGAVTVDQMDIQIPDQLPVSITELEVEEIGTRTSTTAPSERQGAIRPKTPTDLKIDIDIPNRTYVRGRGLDSQWAGALKVRGTLSKPEISGDLNTLRGTMALVGETFDITKGNIEFLGGSTINPQMDIVAAHERNNITTKVSLSGRARDPKVALSSVPPLPDNEILSQLLYGRSSASLSAVEALQLANSVRTLTGGGGGGLLGKARSGLGLDVLTVEGGEGGTGPTVSGGKHLSDRVYVEVGKGATSAGDSVGVQIEITDQISLETDLSTQAGTNVGVKWEHDY